MDVNKHKNELLFVPLGGSGEIGLNFNLYHYQGKWLIVDFGAGFADEYLPGVDMIVPDISFIAKHKKDVVGIILTHAHEDHLGAVQYLWDEIGCTIYTTPFTASFLKAKLVEFGLAHEIPIVEVAEMAKSILRHFLLNMYNFLIPLLKCKQWLLKQIWVIFFIQEIGNLILILLLVK